MHFGRGVLYRAQLLTGTDIQQVRERIHTVPAGLWHPPGQQCTAAGMSTIGEALYRNRDRMDYYARCARAGNLHLYRHFRGVYEAVAGFFEQRYSAPVVFAEDLAIPGFHVFSYPRRGMHRGGGWHFDTLHLSVPFLAARRAQITAVVNFTLPVEVPSGGTGMDLCDGGPGDDGQGCGARIAAPYTPGVMVFSEHEYWHRIGDSTCCEDGERRITMQGHGVCFRDQWLLFW